MTKDGFAKHLAMLQKAEREVREAGQKEYAHVEEDAFANFVRVGNALGIDKEKVLMVYLLKHIDGINAWINGHRSQRESIHGRIKDARLYLALLDGMIAEVPIFWERSVTKDPEAFRQEIMKSSS